MKELMTSITCTRNISLLLLELPQSVNRLGASESRMNDSNLVSLQNGPAGEDPRDAIPALNDLLREGAADIVVYTLVRTLSPISSINRII